MSEPTNATPAWQSIPAIERRVFGVLMEKAKTTPEQYPLTLNGLVTGCNQKSNRAPIMSLEADRIETALERLRKLGAVTLIQGSGRVEKYRHHFYEWLGVDKVEAAVMTELLLRGAQTEGQLRSRVSRMEPIADLGTLQNVLRSLKEKRLVVSLSPAGRGHVVSHNLYEPQELERVRREFESQTPTDIDDGESDEPASSAPVVSSSATSASHASAHTSTPRPQHVEPVRSAAPPAQDWSSEIAEIRGELKQLRHDLSDARHEIARLREELGS